MRYVDRHALGRWNPKLRSYVFGDPPVTKSEIAVEAQWYVIDRYNLMSNMLSGTYFGLASRHGKAGRLFTSAARQWSGALSTVKYHCIAWSEL